ncbi:hypothetical protein FNU76_22080 [Chitinimonas arctica]|uniref:Uncharacterized protein n=1 Tax=Chitinimonas arctica TaxID=2594795 RepID=A0A516SKY3_9NEIS|nr:hypothetical protein [Chitinimonas arctica]QDQ28822.1 hypothetical protein FNU76_22080 [Chitinimonas arctica]
MKLFPPLIWASNILVLIALVFNSHAATQFQLIDMGEPGDIEKWSSLTMMSGYVGLFFWVAAIALSTLLFWKTDQLSKTYKVWLLGLSVASFPIAFVLMF